MLDAPSGFDAIANPKLTASDPSRRFYPYYAGFSEAFVSDALSLLSLEKGDVVLDPWVGTGTTTTVAARSGYRAFGIDRNPVLIAIATARSVRSDLAISILSEITSSLRRSSSRASAKASDPLLTWFSPAAVEAIRTLQHRAIKGIGLMAFSQDSRRFSEPEALFHLVFFRATRRLVAGILGSNPTWIRQKKAERRIAISMSRLMRVLGEEIDALHEHFVRHSNGGRVPRLLAGDTTETDRLVGKRKVAAIITSPPYGTRIDYGIATSIELACLAAHHLFDIEEVRRSLIGTTLTSHMSAAPETYWGAAANEFLVCVGRHPSKASATYYSRYYENYFARLWDSFAAISRIASSGTKAVLVLQGSYYKEVYLDLALVAEQMLYSLGWKLMQRTDRRVTTSFTLLNPSARRYPKPHPPIESVISLVL